MVFWKSDSKANNLITLIDCIISLHFFTLLSALFCKEKIFTVIDWLLFNVTWAVFQSLLQNFYGRQAQTGWPLQNIHFSNGSGSFPFYIDFFLTFINNKTFSGLNYEYHDRCLIRNRNCWPFMSTWFYPQWVVFFCFVCLLSVLCAQCCLLLWIVCSWLHFGISLIMIHNENMLSNNKSTHSQKWSNWDWIFAHHKGDKIRKSILPCNNSGIRLIWLIDFWCLMPLSAIFQLYHGDQF